MVIEEEIIIPDEKQVDILEYRKEVTKNERHGNIVKEFSDFYNLGLTFKDVGVEENNYNGYMWSRAIAMLGHIAIQKTENIVFYIPDVITDRQYEYLKKHRKEFSRYNKRNISILNIYIENEKFNQERISYNHVGDYEDIIDVLYELIEEKWTKKEKGELDVSRIRH